MSSADVDPPDGGRTANHDEPAIGTTGCSSKAEQSLSTGDVTIINDIPTTKTTPDNVFGGVAGGLDTAEKLASDPAAFLGEQNNLYDKEVLTCFLPSS